jgi:clan AA aspartic protease
MRIEGYLDENDQPRIRVIVTGIRKETSFDAIIDTGFDGHLCLPVQVAIQVGLELYGAQVSELADGSTRDELVFIGQVALENQPGVEVEISLTESEDALVGVALLMPYKLEIDFPKRTAFIEIGD